MVDIASSARRGIGLQSGMIHGCDFRYLASDVMQLLCSFNRGNKEMRKIEAALANEFNKFHGTMRNLKWYMREDKVNENICTGAKLVFDFKSKKEVEKYVLRHSELSVGSLISHNYSGTSKWCSTAPNWVLIFSSIIKMQSVTLSTEVDEFYVKDETKTST